MIKFNQKISFERIILTAIILLGFIMRWYNWSHLKDLTWDEASNSLAGVMMARTMLQGFDFNYLHQFMNNYWASTGSLFFFPWGYTILSTVSFMVLGFSE